MVLNFFVNNLMNKIDSSNFFVMNGGKKAIENSINGIKGNPSISNGIKFESVLLLFLFALLLLLIKGYIVYILYNFLVPEIIYSLSNKSKEEIKNYFKPISFMQSILLVILFNTLFNT